MRAYFESTIGIPYRTVLGVVAFIVAISVALIGAALTEGTTGPLNTTGERFSSSASGELGGVSTLLPLGFAFAAGIVSAVNPCGFSMLAPYLGLYLGTDSGSAEGEKSGRDLLLALKVGGTVTLGFILLFGAVGLAIGLGANTLIKVFPWIGLVLGFLLAGAGAWMVSGGKLYTATAQDLASRVTSTESRSLRGYFAFGLSYGTASLSCTLPILLSVIGGSIAVSGLANALGQFLLYGLGKGSVIMALTLALAVLKTGLSSRLRLLLPYIEPLGAVLMLVAGSYVLYYWLTIGGLGDRIV